MLYVVHVDATGNFSFDVLKTALKNLYNVELISWTGEEGRSHIDPENESGFIINRKSHWYALRKIHDHWWNLDSLLDKPEHISPFYLSAYVAQLRNEGSSVFLVRGELPVCGHFNHDLDDTNPQALLWEESKLLGTKHESSNLSNYNENDDEDLMLALALSESMNS